VNSSKIKAASDAMLHFLWQIVSFVLTSMLTYTLIAYHYFLLLVNSSISNKVKITTDAVLYIVMANSVICSNSNADIHFNCIPPFTTFSEQPQQQHSKRSKRCNVAFLLKIVYLL
jgi:hypothetical protein